MENEDLTKTEIIDLVVEYNNNDTRQVLFFIKRDCSIPFTIEEQCNQGIDYYDYNYTYNIVYNDMSSSIDFHDKNYFQNIDCVYSYNSKDVLISLFELLSDEEIENIKNVALKMKERKKIKKDNSVNSPLININNSNNNTNINNNSNIETYSDLRSFVENNSNIENKTEIVNLIKELEKSKDDENKKDYIDKFLKLLELLENVLPIPPAIIKGAKTAKKFFDSVRGKNEK